MYINFITHGGGGGSKGGESSSEKEQRDKILLSVGAKNSDGYLLHYST